MGITKAHRFTEQQNNLATMAKALAHPARIAILQYLSTQKNCVCGSIVNEIGLAQATVSQHLKALKEAGLVQGTVDGVRTCYCLDTQRLENVKGQLANLLENCCQSNSCC
tara:strand:+ start:49 stop:378 length:330 start_codon:yes stop_codon:yes gene_type:complete